MKNYYVQKENWLYPKRKQRINMCCMAERWIDKVHEECQYGYSITSQTVNLKSWLWRPKENKRTNKQKTNLKNHNNKKLKYPKEVARKSDLCSTVVPGRVQAPLHAV